MSEIVAPFKKTNLRSSALSVPRIGVILMRIASERRFEGPK